MYICLACNEKDDASYISSLMGSFVKDSQSEPQSKSDDPEQEVVRQEHQLWHTLVLCRPGVAEAAEVVKPKTVDERIASVETRMVSLESSMKRLEDMLERLLSGRDRTM